MSNEILFMLQASLQYYSCMAPNNELLTPEQYLIFRRWLVANDSMEAYLNRALAVFGLSMTEYRMLVVLTEAPAERLRMSDLANDAHHSLSRSSHTIARMEARGWVKRIPHESDRRVTYVTMLPDGTALLERARPHYHAAVRRVFINAVGDKMDELEAILTGIIAATTMR